MNLSNIYYLHEIGRKKNQEDYIWPAPGTAVPENKIFIICDGVGGSENGEIASRMIADYTGNILLQTPPENITITYINSLLEAAKQNLINYAVAQGLNKDMATTFSLLMIFSNKVFIAWCGDSRVYHIRNGEVLYKTEDHSLVSTLVKNGEITEQDALTHPQKHIILKAITGDDSIIEADGEWITDLAHDDYFMLCTDGLLENITDDDLRKILSANRPVNADIMTAMQEKCFGKTRDNYSMYLLQINLQTTATLQKSKKSYTALWLILSAVILITATLFFFNRKNIPAETMPAAAFKPDSAATPAASANTVKDTVLKPGKNAVPDSEIINKNEAEDNKITPQPLPETTSLTDSARLKKGLPARATDTLPKHGKPLN